MKISKQILLCYNFIYVKHLTLSPISKVSKVMTFSICVFQGSKTGKDNGFTMLFDIESFDYSYYNEGSEGLKLALVHHLDMPIMRQKGFHIAPGTENQIAVTPTLMSTSDNAMTR